MSSKCLINVTNENERLIQYNEISLTVHSKLEEQILSSKTYNSSKKDKFYCSSC
jgi:hypothetical protein